MSLEGWVLSVGEEGFGGGLGVAEADAGGGGVFGGEFDLVGDGAGEGLW